MFKADPPALGEKILTDNGVSAEELAIKYHDADFLAIENKRMANEGPSLPYKENGRQGNRIKDHKAPLSAYENGGGKNASPHFHVPSNEEMIQSFESQYRTETNDMATRLSFLRRAKNLALAGLQSNDFWELSSKNPEAQERYSRILGTFQEEENELETFLDTDDEAVLALIKTREMEIEKMKTEIEIRWMQKKVYDLQVDSSPEKTALQDEVKRLETKRQSILQDTLFALKEEEAILKKENGYENSERFWYVKGRLIEMESLLPKSDD